MPPRRKQPIKSKQLGFKKKTKLPMIKYRPFLKWAGGKFRLTEELNKVLPKKNTCLVEPFVGAGAVFLNTNFERYILADINPDLINLFNFVKSDVERYIEAAKAIFFHPEANTSQYYYTQREQFNRSSDTFERSVIFLYLNRFGFNGLCRYNSKNEFNVPFGSYKRHYFPEAELRYFAQKAQHAEFICADFQHTFSLADEKSIIYCDPPYAPLIQESNFTSYAGNEFSAQHQKVLADLASYTAEERHISVVISNHDTAFTRDIYQKAKLKAIQVQRSISQQSNRRIKVTELIAVFNAK
ncbi:Dam family site-specific DNA-(adenine-N6)-methyltransferase [Pasteurella canis]|uniref:Site-specific DNA-methyltransferase (adenine-specific) n=1 Tax=Pasteurella canis TaxID=753 RepID=A0A379EXL1_9PAST|nr:Dam family site-specific DNA-(adenine-N6)-methyltransferase [Pasteurella canis]UAY77720.1 Dam family site-specific DNA-(adenine-N6)-methyltransferase [Pasteurella canis]UEA16813.1 Dam family site-specific DNA-(adenine-N6)-methyltransferase [Pasteurella canis]UEC23253.1 Dam family site-specific DNA-(adenine-N6)-methyltransferase [Pasteurella canis]SPY33843.1 DNA adenine methylase [Pasteurella canis]SUC11106.1 DNA adenine methylase [Pasteurella canis]